jgi:type I restriction enzyme S subunit
MKAEGKVPKDDRWKSKYREPVKPDTSELPELPEGWVWATVEQVGHVQLGRQRAPKYHHGEHMRPYLRVANVFEDRIDTTDILHMNFTPAEFRTYSLQHGDVLLNEGQSLELVGRPAMYRDEVPGACFQNTLVRFRPYQGLTSAFALCVFRSYLHNGRFQRIAKWTTNIAHLGAGRFAEIEFPLPPLTEQRRILAEVERRFSIMDELEATIATNLKRADRLRQAILKRAFEGKLVPQDSTDEPASVLLERIRMERERATEKPKAIPQQTNSHKPTVQPKAATPVQGELALGFRA